MKNYYEIMGISHKANPEEIKHRFHFLAQAYHPDKFKEQDQKKEAEDEFKRIGEAYEVLINSSKRAQYDRLLVLVQENERKKEYQAMKRETAYAPPKNKKPTYSDPQPDIQQNERKTKKGNIWLWIILGIIIWVIYDLISNGGSSYSLKNSDNTYRQPTNIIYATPTFSTIVDKANVLNTAQNFSNLLENGNAGAKFMLDTTSRYYSDYLDLIDGIVHDTLKWGKYLRIYDLSLSSYTNNRATVSGFMENNSFYSWLKYYYDIYLVKRQNNWYIEGWSMTKT